MNFLTSELIFYILAAFALVTGLLVVLKANPVGSAVCLALCFAAAAGIMFQLDAQFLGTIQILVYTGAIMVLIVFVVMLLNLKEEKKTFVKPLPLVCGLAIAVLFMAQLIGVVYSIPGACESKPFMCDETQRCAWDDLSIGTGGEGDGPGIPVQSLDEFEGFVNPDKVRITRIEEEGALVVITESGIESRYFSDAVPQIGHSPASTLPEVSLNRVAYPEESSLAASVEKGNFPDASLLGYRLYSKYNRELVISGLALLAATIGSVVLTRRPKKH